MGWLGECCSELGTPSTFPRTLLGVNGEKWQSWCGLEVVAISEGGEG